jgi:hypothetical protein
MHSGFMAQPFSAVPGSLATSGVFFQQALLHVRHRGVGAHFTTIAARKIAAYVLAFAVSRSEAARQRLQLGGQFRHFPTEELYMGWRTWRALAVRYCQCVDLDV